ncbi:MAG: 30S ribosomal protein S6 [Phycisphaerales bacterium JB040]
MTTETTARTGTFEVMLLASQSAAAQLGSLMEHFQQIFDRAGATVLAMKKWDDRRLAYEIDKQKRGVYFLAYIDCPVDQVAHIERDVQISEQVIRVLVTRASHLTEEEIASSDDRQALADEARMKGAESAADSGDNAKVHLGAPTADERSEEPQPEDTSDESDDSDDDDD